MRELGTKVSMLNEGVLLIIWILRHRLICILKLVDTLGGIRIKVVLRILVTWLRVRRGRLKMASVVLVGLRCRGSHLYTLWVVCLLLLGLDVRIVRTIAGLRRVPKRIDPAPSMHLIVAFSPIIQIIRRDIIDLLVINLLWIHINYCSTLLPGAFSLVWGIIRPSKRQWVPLLDILLPLNIHVNLLLLRALIALLFHGLVPDFLGEIRLHALVEICIIVFHLRLPIRRDITSVVMVPAPVLVYGLAWRTTHRNQVWLLFVWELWIGRRSLRSGARATRERWEGPVHVMSGHGAFSRQRWLLSVAYVFEVPLIQLLPQHFILWDVVSNLGGLILGIHLWDGHLM